MKEEYHYAEHLVPGWRRIEPYEIIEKGDRWFHPHDKPNLDLNPDISMTHVGATPIEMWNKQGRYAHMFGYTGPEPWAVYRRSKNHRMRVIRTNPYAACPLPLP